MWPSPLSRCRWAAAEPGAGVSSASRVLPRAGAMVRPGAGVQHVCTRTPRPLPPHGQEQGPLGLSPCAGQGEEGKFLPCFQGNGKTSKWPQSCLFLAHASGAMSRIPRSTWAKLRFTAAPGSPRLRGHRSAGTRDVEHPPSCHPTASPAPSTIASSSIVSTTRGQKPPPSKAA